MQLFGQSCEVGQVAGEGLAALALCGEEALCASVGVGVLQGSFQPVSELHAGEVRSVPSLALFSRVFSEAGDGIGVPVDF